MIIIFNYYIYYSVQGYLDIPNGKEKILDRFKNYPQRLKDSPNQ